MVMVGAAAEAATTAADGVVAIGVAVVAKSTRCVDAAVTTGKEAFLTRPLFCRVSNSSSWSGIGTSSCLWPGWYFRMCFDRSPL